MGACVCEYGKGLAAGVDTMYPKEGESKSRGEVKSGGDGSEGSDACDRITITTKHAQGVYST